MVNCNICANKKFGGGPGGRMSASGSPPRCEKCQSLERHRAYRDVFDQLRDESFKALSFLQFSQDRTVEANWFATHEVSIYGGDNSLDLQKIAKDSYQYDIVMCNHVLEHVPYDNAALCELLRITKKEGFVFLTVPSPTFKQRTTDWGYPKEEQHGHYRIYGKDFEQMLLRYLPHAWILSVKAEDKVTQTEDIVFFLCHGKVAMEKLKNRLNDIVIIQSGLP